MNEAQQKFIEQARLLGFRFSLYSSGIAITLNGRLEISELEIAQNPAREQLDALFDSRCKALKMSLINEIDRMSAEMRKR